MLIAMTFNAGLLIAIILGLTTSYFIFGLNIPAGENLKVSVLNNSGQAEVGYIVARSDETTKGEL
jgi:hypothetical protein